MAMLRRVLCGHGVVETWAGLSGYSLIVIVKRESAPLNLSVCFVAGFRRRRQPPHTCHIP
eukprot:4613781-Prymnesium_polylepis.1